MSYDELNNHPLRLNLGCGRNILDGWLNIDNQNLPGVNIVFDLNSCKSIKLPFADNSIDEFFLSHILEHIYNSLDLMEELYRVAKPNAKLVCHVPFGSSDYALEDPTHVRSYFVGSWGYFAQPNYWRADYGYLGDWATKVIELFVKESQCKRLSADVIMDMINEKRNIVVEMRACMHAIKPKREPLHELQDPLNIMINFIAQ